MKTKHLSLTFAALTIYVAACKKTNIHPHIPVTAADTAVNVYTAGYITTGNGLGGVTEIAAYWKNGVITRLTDSLSFSEATGIAVSGNDVYVVGWVTSLTNLSVENAVLWKNGVATMLSPDSTSSEARCIALQGTDVYVGGIIHDIITQTSNSTAYGSQPVYWKNGTPNLLPKATSLTALAVNGGDLYFAGSVVSTNKFQATGPLGPGSVAAYWKNGAMPDTLAYPGTYLTEYSSIATGIAVSGSNVYTTGSTGIYQPELWLNGSPTIMTGTTSLSSVYGIATNGRDVYVAGVNTNYYVATYWKNNEPIPLSVGTLSMTNSFATAVAANGNDVYVAGQVRHAADQEYGSYYWKNGIPVELSAGSGKGAYVKSIALAPKN
ncbi:MAG TPA: hypothetical protein VFE53_00005 [Mucilaginibacter sp.]|jgi:hypothetical protein|nr:hypothetical protein [Mucilaginibacter sp.]